MEISAELVKRLRELTDCGFMDCKKALQETRGNVEEAVAYLRQKGIAVARKRGERATSEGAVWALVNPEANSGVLLEVNCESDFVARTDAFQEFGAALAAQIAASPPETVPADVDQLLAQPWQARPQLTVGEYLHEVMGKIGENLKVHRFVRYNGDGLVSAYIHHGAKIGVLLELTGGDPTPEAKNLAKDLAMQVAAANPLAISREDLDPAVVAKEKAIFEAQAQESGKPAKIIERMVTGRLEKFYKEVCLLEQPFVKDPDITVAQLLQQIAAASGRTWKVRRFARYQVGVA